MKKPEYHDWDTTVGRGFTRWCNDLDKWDEGEFCGEHGIVSIYRQGSPWFNNNSHATRDLTRFDFVWGGIHHTRSYMHLYTRLGCSRIARKYAEEITAVI